MADLTITAANVLAGAGSAKALGTAGEAITAGQSLYIKAADGLLYKAIDTSAAAAAAVGIALNNAGTGQPISYLTSGPITIGATVAIGSIYGVTDTAGGIADVVERLTGDYVTILGVATTAAIIQVDITRGGVAVAA